MNIIDKILLEWRYQLPSGYPKTDSDYHKLGEVLSEMTDLDQVSIQRIVEHARTGNIISEAEEIFTPDNNSKFEDDLSDLLSDISSGISKQQQYAIMAEYTRNHYEFGKLIQTNFSVSDLVEQDYYGVDIKTMSAANSIEAIIMRILEIKTGIPMEHVTSQSQGIDGRSRDGRYLFEIKSSKLSQPNVNLQTTFYKADTPDQQKYYIFIHHDGTGYNFTKFHYVYIVSSDLLRKVTLGTTITKELQLNNISDTLTNQIETGLSDFDFKNQIISALTTGDTSGFKKQFDIGNNVAIVFKIFIQPKKLGLGEGIDEGFGGIEI